MYIACCMSYTTWYAPMLCFISPPPLQLDVCRMCLSYIGSICICYVTPWGMLLVCKPDTRGSVASEGWGHIILNSPNGGDKIEWYSMKWSGWAYNTSRYAIFSKYTCTHVNMLQESRKFRSPSGRSCGKSLATFSNTQHVSAGPLRLILSSMSQIANSLRLMYGDLAVNETCSQSNCTRSLVPRPTRP